MFVKEIQISSIKLDTIFVLFGQVIESKVSQHSVFVFWFQVLVLSEDLNGERVKGRRDGIRFHNETNIPPSAQCLQNIKLFSSLNICVSGRGKELNAQGYIDIEVYTIF